MEQLVSLRLGAESAPPTESVLPESNVAFFSAVKDGSVEDADTILARLCFSYVGSLCMGTPSGTGPGCTVYHIKG